MRKGERRRRRKKEEEKKEEEKDGEDASDAVREGLNVNDGFIKLSF